MIAPDYGLFPSNVVALVRNLLKLLDEDVVVKMRPLKIQDPVQAIGVYAVDSEDEEESQEMRGILLPAKATVIRYALNIQVLHKDADEERGIATHAAMVKLVTSTVANNVSLRGSLAALSNVYLGTRESFQKLTLGRTRYMSGEINSQFAYMAVCEYIVETESKPEPV